MGLKLPRIEFRGRKFDSSISFLILFTGLFLSVAMPLLVPRDPGPDAMTSTFPTKPTTSNFILLRTRFRRTWLQMNDLVPVSRIS